jgi:hypothetical protein
VGVGVAWVGVGVAWVGVAGDLVGVDDGVDGAGLVVVPRLLLVAWWLADGVADAECDDWVGDGVGVADPDGVPDGVVGSAELGAAR